MPTISEFHGITIRMFHSDHVPPRFHAIHGEYEAVFGLDPITTLGGNLPSRARRLVVQWASKHQAELVANWDLAQRLEPLQRVAPLD